MEGIDVQSIENAFEWESFENGKPYLGTYRYEIPNRVKMMTRGLDLKNWIKIDKTYASQQREKERLLKTKRNDVFVSNKDESTSLAKKELLEMLCEYLPERFPDKFKAKEGGVYNKMLDELILSSDGPGEDDPLIKCGRLTQEDWCVMEWSDEHQAYCLTAGIHQPVDGYTKNIKTLVQNVLKNLIPDKPIYRGNWSISGDLDGPLDLHNTVTRDHLNDEKGGKCLYDGAKTGRVLTFRCEYQTLRKLRKSKAIIFSIRTYLMYLEDFKGFTEEDTVMLIKAIEGIHPDFLEYKGVPHWKDAALKYLKFDVLGERNTFSGNLLDSSWKVSLSVGIFAVLAFMIFKQTRGKLI